MEPRLCFHVGRMSGFRSGEPTKVVHNVANADAGAELSVFCQKNTFEASLAKTPAVKVLHITSAIDDPQVAPPVVASNAVDVVDFFGRPLPCHPQPSEAMRIEAGPQNPNLPVSTDGGCAGDAEGQPHPLWPCDPDKVSGFWVVTQKLAQALRSKIGLSHEAPTMLIGQRPVGVSSTVRASPF